MSYAEYCKITLLMLGRISGELSTHKEAAKIARPMLVMS